jgi:hypothetical protein
MKKNRKKSPRRAAFEQVLYLANIPFVDVDDAKRAIFAGADIGTFDYLVYRQDGPNLLVMLKDRQAAVTNQNVADLAEWEKVFGAGFAAVFVFDPLQSTGLHTWIMLGDWVSGERRLQVIDDLFSPSPCVPVSPSGSLFPEATA